MFKRVNVTLKDISPKFKNPLIEDFDTQRLRYIYEHNIASLNSRLYQ